MANQDAPLFARCLHSAEASWKLIPGAIALASFWPALTSAATIPSVAVACTSCKSYADLSAFALLTAKQLGVGATPPGFMAGNFTQPGVTTILVSATTAPMTFAFNYSATRQNIGTLGTYYYTYAIIPTTTFPASDRGAVDTDFMMYKAMRASGLPVVQLPATDKNGFAVTPSTSYEDINRLISYSVFINAQPPKLSTLPGLLNWSLLPMIKVTYGGKTYNLYDGDSFTIRYADGSTAQVTVQAATFGMTVGYVLLKPETIKGPTGAPVSAIPAPPAGSFSGASIPTLDPVTLLWSGVPTIVVTPYANFTVTPSVTVYQECTSCTTPFLWEFYDLG